MLRAGLDLSQRKIDVCLLSGMGEIVDEWASPPDANELARSGRAPACGAAQCAG
jgi:hypothetical protein